MKTVYQFLLIALFQIVAISSYSQDVILSSQYDVYQFNQTTINGDLIINDNPAVADAIIDLSPLGMLQSVTGDVIIEDNPQLAYLGGFNNLGDVDGDFIIRNNPSLLSMDQVSILDLGGDLIILNNVALQNIDNNFWQLFTIGGKLEIKDQPNLEDVHFNVLLSVVDGISFIGCSWENLNFNSLFNVGEINFVSNYPPGFNSINWGQLTIVTGNISFNSNQGISFLDQFGSLTSVSAVFIDDNQSLTNIGGFSQLTSLNILQIEGNSVLSSITGFGSLETVLGDFTINENADIGDLSGFSQLETVNGNFSINSNGGFSLNSLNGSAGNASVIPLAGFGSLTTVGGDFSINNNGAFTSIDGFNSLESCSNFYIESNAFVSGISGFANLQMISTDFQIYDNSSLQSIPDFGALSSIGGGMYIFYNPMLSEIIGFNSLNSVTGYVDIRENNVLTTIDGFDNLTSMGGPYIYNNPQLTTVDGFQNITTLSLGLYLENNTSLSLCCWLAPLVNAISDPSNITISNNGSGCSSLAELSGGGPTITCPNDETVNSDPGSCTNAFSFTDPTPVSTCGIESYTVSLQGPDGNYLFQDLGAFGGFEDNSNLDLGTSIFIYEVTDVFGATTSCTYLVTVEDTELPTWDAPSNDLALVGECGDDVTAIFLANEPTALDNCGIFDTSFAESSSIGSCSNEVIYVREYEAIDLSGNVSETFTVTLLLPDTQAPILGGLPDDITINCNDPIPAVPSSLTAFDACEGDLTIEIDDIPETILGSCVFGEFSEIIETTISVTDGCNNIATHTWTVTVINDFEVDLGSDIVVCDANSYTLDAGVGQSYVWSNGATTQTIDVTNSGNYEVTVTSLNECCSVDDINVDFISGLTATAIGGVIDCTGSNVTISGSSSASGVSYNWTGPGGFTSTTQNPSVSMTGDYTLTVQDSNGCTASDVATVSPDTDVPDLTATGGLIDCNNPSTTITSTSTQATSIAWTGPNGFTSTVSNPIVSESGTYSVVVTAANGCTNSTSVTVEGDFTEPGVMVNGGTIDCSNTSVLITASSSSTITNYAWTGPNGFTSTQQVISAVEPGTYSVTVIGSNGCTSTAGGIVMEDLTPPIVISDAGVLTCNNSTASITAESVDAISYSWIGPDGFVSSLQNNTISISGLYTVVATAANGCTASSTVEVLENITTPIVSTTDGIIDCINTMTTISASSDDMNATYLWSGPSNFSEAGSSVATTVSGIYTVIVTASNGCTASATSEVTSDVLAPSLSLEVGDVDCNSASIAITASTDVNAEVTWTGPNGFTAMGTSITVESNGDYSALSTNTDNGCTATQSISIVADLSTPTAMATGGELSCSNTAVQLMGSSNTMSVSYQWTGQGGYTSLLQNPAVDEAGTYTLVVTSMNGCTSTASTMVTTDPDLPNASVTGSDIDCNNTEVQLTGTTSTTGAVGSWSGPDGFTSDDMTISVSAAGQYVYTVIGGNGCEATASYEVMEDIAEPNLNILLGDVNCLQVGQDLAIDSAEELNAITWTTPSGQSSNAETLLAIENGTYTVTAIGSNGCVATETIEVDNTSLLPEVSVDWINLSCSNPTTELTVSSNGISFEWSGPQGFNASGLSTIVSQPGEYMVTAFSQFGCSATETIVVEGDFATPSVALSTGEIDCENESISLIAETDENTTITWSGPGGFSGTDGLVVVNQAGTYTALVTNMNNGCVTTETIFVDQDFSVPGATASGGQLSCTLTSIKLSGSTNAEGSTYAWTGPGGFESSEQNPSVEEVGEYILTVTSPNGCTNTAVAIVTTDPSVPNISVSGEDISCLNDEATLVGTTNTPNATILWEGPNNFASNESSITVTQGGVYTVTITGSNGCSATTSYEVLEDISSPVFTIQTGEIDCEAKSQIVTLETDDALSSVVWTLPDGSISNTIETNATENGNYTITAIGSNGCVTSETAFLLFSFNYEVEILTTDETSTEKGTASITIDGGIGNYAIEWDNDDVGFTTSGLDAGEHTVTVIDANGCIEEYAFSIGLMSSTEDDLTSAELNVYPNPANELLQIETDLLDISQIVMYNQRGQEVLTHNIGDTKQLHILDVSTLEAGIYKVLIMSNSQRIYRTVFIVD